MAAGNMPGPIRPGPAVSVLMIFYNGMAFIAEAVDSLRAQGFDDWELLLVDDGSSDGSTEYALALAAADPGRYRYLRHDGHANRGTSASRNLGLREARGEFLIRLDCDDVFMDADALAEQVALLRAHPGAAMVCGPCQYWNSWRGGSDYLQPFEAAPGEYEPRALLAAMLASGDQEPISMLVRTQAIRDCGGWEEEIRDFGEDFILTGKLLLGKRVLVSVRCWYRYRAHPASYSHSVATRGIRELRERELLAWFGQFLRRAGVKDTAVWAAFRGRQRPLRWPRLRRAHRRLRLEANWLGWRVRMLVNRVSRPAPGTAAGRIWLEPAIADVLHVETLFQSAVAWQVRGTGTCDVRVGAPDGRLFVDAADASGRADTREWVQEGMLFFLQNREAADPTLASATLDVVRARVRILPAPAEPVSE